MNKNEISAVISDHIKSHPGQVMRSWSTFSVITALTFGEIEKPAQKQMKM